MPRNNNASSFSITALLSALWNLFWERLFPSRNVSRGRNSSEEEGVALTRMGAGHNLSAENAGEGDESFIQVNYQEHLVLFGNSDSSFVADDEDMGLALSPIKRKDYDVFFDGSPVNRTSFASVISVVSKETAGSRTPTNSPARGREWSQDSQTEAVRVTHLGSLIAPSDIVEGQMVASRPECANILQTVQLKSRKQESAPLGLGPTSMFVGTFPITDSDGKQDKFVRHVTNVGGIRHTVL
jgi:hypothetical protein